MLMIQEVETLGEARVRIKFNPSHNDRVSQIKALAADLINRVNAIQGDDEVRRCVALAMTAFEDGAMWAVKAVTAPRKSARLPLEPVPYAAG